MKFTAALILAANCAWAAQPDVRVGSKKFTESVILGELAAQMLKEKGVAAVHRKELGGTRVLFEALLRGDIQIYPEYTGTLRYELLPKMSSASNADVEAELAKIGLKATKPLGFNNTYALGMREEVAQRTGIKTLSDLNRHPELRFGLSNEFMNRVDGWPAVKNAYQLPQADVRGMDHDLAYRALKDDQVEVTDLYSTDAEIPYLNLRVLEDDRHHFPEYQAVFLYRSDLDARARNALSELEGQVDQAAMAKMNASAKIERVPEAKVASGFLADHFGLHTHVQTDGLWTRLRLRTWEHLFLVGVSLASAIAFGIPLGIWASRRRRIGPWVLSTVGMIQTIPSLALLVLMIPLLGIGARPAIAALFLYGLLPIVRGTHAGLTSIPAELIDSADALGLPGWYRLWRIELPMASPSVLSGIQTAAVIDVGAATLGALIGAGGYGQPILTGIRLDSVRLIFEGAIPAALLALLVQTGFDFLGLIFIPKGLRLSRPAKGPLKP